MIATGCPDEPKLSLLPSFAQTTRTIKAPKLTTCTALNAAIVRVQVSQAVNAEAEQPFNGLFRCVTQ
jgi:hypothetical protein